MCISLIYNLDSVFDVDSEVSQCQIMKIGSQNRKRYNEPKSPYGGQYHHFFKIAIFFIKSVLNPKKIEKQIFCLAQLTPNGANDCHIAQ